MRAPRLVRRLGRGPGVNGTDSAFAANRHGGIDGAYDVEGIRHRARRLTISKLTAYAYVEHILSTPGRTSRTQITVLT